MDQVSPGRPDLADEEGSGAAAPERERCGGGRQFERSDAEGAPREVVALGEGPFEADPAAQAHEIVAHKLAAGAEGTAVEVEAGAVRGVSLLLVSAGAALRRTIGRIFSRGGRE